MSRLAGALAVAVLATLAGCGTGTTDLMSIEVTTTAGGLHHERMRVTDDGRASCGGALHEMPSHMLLDARAVKRTLRPLARRGASFLAGRSVSHYLFRSFDGSVRWDVGATVPPSVGRATLFAVRLERQVCPHRIPA